MVLVSLLFWSDYMTRRQDQVVSDGVTGTRDASRLLAILSAAIDGRHLDTNETVLIHGSKFPIHMLSED